MSKLVCLIPAIILSVVDEPKPVSQVFLGELLNTYRDIGLPLPPEGAELVRFEHEWGGGDNPPYTLAFLLRAGTKDKPPLLLVGTELYEPAKGREIVPVKPNAALAKETASEWLTATFDVNVGLATALQCKARGWDELALALWEKSITRSTGHHRGMFKQAANLPSTSALYHLAWVHWANEIVRPGSNRAEIPKRIERLFEAEPSLATVENKSLLRSLKLTLIPSKAKPGSIEALIDGLADITELPNQVKPDESYDRLARLGKAAVPALLDHLNDERLTRSAAPGFNNMPPHIRILSEDVEDILRRLAGEEASRGWRYCVPANSMCWSLEKLDVIAWCRSQGIDVSQSKKTAK